MSHPRQPNRSRRLLSLLPETYGRLRGRNGGNLVVVIDPGQLRSQYDIAARMDGLRRPTLRQPDPQRSSAPLPPRLEARGGYVAPESRSGDSSDSGEPARQDDAQPQGDVRS